MHKKFNPFVVFFLLGDSLAFCVDVSEHSICSIVICRVLTPLTMMEQSVLKRRHIKFKRQEITQKNEYNIQNMAKV
jgi:hypothetical protein